MSELFKEEDFPLGQKVREDKLIIIEIIIRIIKIMTRTYFCE